MGFKEIGYTALRLMVGGSITATYLRAMDTVGDVGTYLTHLFEGGDGVVWGLAGATLDNRMKEVPPGSICRVTRHQPDASSKYGTKMRMYRVEVDDDTPPAPKLSTVDDLIQETEDGVEYAPEPKKGPKNGRRNIPDPAF